MKAIHELIKHFCKNQRLTREQLQLLNENGFVKKGTYLPLIAHLPLIENTHVNIRPDIWLNDTYAKNATMYQLHKELYKEVRNITGVDAFHLSVAPKPQAESKNLDLGKYPLTPPHSSATISPQIKRTQTKAKAEKAATK